MLAAVVPKWELLISLISLDTWQGEESRGGWDIQGNTQARKQTNFHSEGLLLSFTALIWFPTHLSKQKPRGGHGSYPEEKHNASEEADTASFMPLQEACCCCWHAGRTTKCPEEQKMLNSMKTGSKPYANMHRVKPMHKANISLGADNTI